MSQFLTAATTKDSRTWNDAISHSTTGNSCLDYFAKCGSYRGRTQAEVDKDMASIFGEDETTALSIVFYNRMVTRRARLELGEYTEVVQKGQGQKDEFIRSIIWLSKNRPQLLQDNLWLIPIAGCWKDLWYDSPVTGLYHYIDPTSVYNMLTFVMGNADNNIIALIAKYLPRIRSKSNVKNQRHRRQNAWAIGLCEHLSITQKEYRHFKSNPIYKAHLWQRQMSHKQWDNIDFGKIPGKALFNIIKGKILGKHNIEEKYLNWIETQPVAKFTGYIYELLKAAQTRKNVSQTYTYNKQFDGLLDLAKESDNEFLKKGVLCALDTSGSMVCQINNDSNAPTALDVCVSLGIYFSSLLEGLFKDHVIAFSDNSKIYKLNGNFCNRVDQIKAEPWWMGSTNFQSVIDEIVRVRQNNPKIPVEEFPGILLVVSDMQFNPAIKTSIWSYGSSQYTPEQEKTNYETAMAKLEAVGLPKMTVVWWQVNGRDTVDFPSKMDDEGTVLISGFDPAIVSRILGKDTVVDKTTGEKRKMTPLETMINCLDQELLNKLVIR